MSVAEVFNGAQAATPATEHTLVETGGTNDLVVGKAYVAKVDLTNLGADTVEIRIYLKSKTGGSTVLWSKQTFTGVPAEPLLLSPPFPVSVYAKVTLKQTTGSGHTFDWSVDQL